MNLFRTTIVGIALLAASLSAAKPPFLKVLFDTYKIDPNSPLGRAKCLSCHQPPAPPKRNSYGLDVQAAMEAAHSRMLTAEILKSLDKKDSDGDGIPNGVEIRAGSLPYDKKSKPGKKHAQMPNNSGTLLLAMGFVPVGFLCLTRRKHW